MTPCRACADTESTSQEFEPEHQVLLTRDIMTREVYPVPLNLCTPHTDHQAAYAARRDRLARLADR
jgi:hypothetical protein